MPACFTLTKKSELEKGPVGLQMIDEEMCKHFNEPVHEKYWYHGWYDSIGFGLATGKTYADLLTEVDRDMLEVNLRAEQFKWYLRKKEVILWLQENYEPNNWTEIGKR